MRGQQEAEDVHRDEEAAGDEQVHHVVHGFAPQDELSVADTQRLQSHLGSL